jgi:hypothetical protein
LSHTDRRSWHRSSSASVMTTVSPPVPWKLWWWWTDGVAWPLPPSWPDCSGSP